MKFCKNSSFLCLFFIDLKSKTCFFYFCRLFVTINSLKLMKKIFKMFNDFCFINKKPFPENFDFCNYEVLQKLSSIMSLLLNDNFFISFSNKSTKKNLYKKKQKKKFFWGFCPWGFWHGDFVRGDFVFGYVPLFHIKIIS